jgi:hypothetical protein
LCLSFFSGLVQIKEHHHTGLGIETGKSDQADPGACPCSNLTRKSHRPKQLFVRRIAPISSVGWVFSCTDPGFRSAPPWPEFFLRLGRVKICLALCASRPPDFSTAKVPFSAEPLPERLQAQRLVAAPPLCERHA